MQKLQQIVKDLQEIDKLRPRVQDIQVPLEVFDYIDAGRNPQFFTKDCMEKALSKNEEEKGKVSRIFEDKGMWTESSSNNSALEIVHER